MNWAITRQIVFAFGALVVAVALGVGGYFAFFYRAPSCTDGVQNGDEVGVDCDGSCVQLCVQPPITPLWARSVRVAPGVYHAVALIKNPNTEAAGVVPYTVSLFDMSNILIATREGEFNLLPGESAPLFEANVITGERTPTRTFVDVGMGTFEKRKREASKVRVLSFDVVPEERQVTALVENQTLFPVQDISVTALIFDANDVLAYASQTTVDVLAPRERKQITFTWQEPLTVTGRVDIIPRTLR